MFDIWTSTATLQQPCLHRPINHHQIDREGSIRGDVLAGIDRLLAERLLSMFQDFKAPTEIANIPMGKRFLNSSALQKAIRRGDAAGAMRFAQQGCVLDQDYIFRRLATCAVEDVGLGNLLVVAMALAAIGDKRLRSSGESLAPRTRETV